MTDRNDAPHYADRAVQRSVVIDQHQRIARDTFRVRFHCPEIAQRIVPGQFMMMKLAGENDPLLARPLAVYDVVTGPAGPESLDVVYLVVGKFTGRLARMQPGQALEVWGPLGNGFPVLACDHLVMVAGGVGQTPFLAVAKEHLGRQQFGEPPRETSQVGQVTLCYGAQSADFLAGVEDFRQAGVQVELATDDGSCGHHGFVTDLLAPVLDGCRGTVHVLCCGPHLMMRTVSELTAQRDVPCLVSLETPMACGVGICFTCVAQIRDPSGQWDYRRTCVEGPVFDATAVRW